MNVISCIGLLFTMASYLIGVSVFLAGGFYLGFLVLNFLAERIAKSFELHRAFVTFLHSEYKKGRKAG